MSTPDHIMARLRALVAEHGSIAAAARELGVTGPAIAGVLRGDHGPGADLCRAIGVPRPVRLPRADPGDEPMGRLHGIIRRHGSVAAAADSMGMSERHIRLVVEGRRSMGHKLMGAIEPDGQAAIRRRMEAARELKRQAWERGRFKIPKDRLGEIR